MSDAPRRTSRRSARAATAAALLGIGLVAATATVARARTAPAAHTLSITTREFAFETADTVEAGVTTLRVLNKGKELHHAQVIALGAGHTLADVFAAMKDGAGLPAWARWVGGPNTPAPGGTSAATVELAPGRYALICLIPSADGVPHFMKGMARELVAVAPRATAHPAAYTAPARTMTLSDYRFDLSRPFARGTQTVRVRNAAAQAHEVVFIKLAPGKTAHDMAAWIEKQDGPPPGLPLGGTTGIASGGWNDVTLTFAPGEYALLCFFPDAGDGKPHVAHGMTAQFSVR